jgi:hypothetical protein
MNETSRGAERAKAGPERMPALDRLFVACFAVFAFTSICMEPYITFGVNLARATSPLGRAWYFYARNWDPLFLDQPAYMRVMTGIDEWVYGPMYLVLIYAFVRRRDWIRLPGLLYCGAIIYSTLVYFLTEFLTEGHRANLTMVTLVNIPYTIVPCLLVWRLWRPSPFAARNRRSYRESKMSKPLIERCEHR